MARGLLAHLADRFVTQREDLATEALLYILNQSSAARDEVARLLADVGAPVDGTLAFKSQSVGDGHERPDLVCLVGGREHALFEMKFWAGLTDNQPVGYLNRLERGSGSALIFVAPEKRLEILWSELERRVTDAGEVLGKRSEPHAATFTAVVGGVSLAALSWTSLLSRVDWAISSADETALKESLGQLRALCDREDGEAFLPLQGAELTGSHPRRLIQFGSLVDDAVSKLVSEGLGDTSGLRAAAGNGWYGRYVRFANAGCLVHVSAEKWAKLQPTPLWVRVKDPEWMVTPALLQALERAQSSGSLEFFEGDGIEVPIFLPAGRERADVLESVVTQLRTLIGVLVEAGLPASGNGQSERPEGDAES